MLAPIGPLVGFAVGTLFAWAARESIARSSEPTVTRPLGIAAAFGAFVFAPACGYFLAFAPDWAYAYLWQRGSGAGAVDLALVLLDAVSVPAGLLACRRPAAARSPIGILRIVALPSLAAAAFVAATLRRTSTFGTYAQFHGDFGLQDVAGSPLGYALLWFSLVVLGVFVWTGYCLKRETSGQPSG